MIKNINEETNINQANLLCISCNFVIENQIDYKLHYKSEFHDYNCKRKIHGLKPISPADFKIKKDENNEILNKIKLAQNTIDNSYCSDCNKKFLNGKTYQEHLKSKKHIKNIKKPKIKKINKNINSVNTTLDDESICLFCNVKSKDFNDNLNHMNIFHNFYFIDEESCIDKLGMVKKLNSLTFKDLVCHSCGIQNFKNGYSVQQHQLDNGHCTINKDNLYLFDDFYDYTEINKKNLEEIMEKTKKYKNFQNKIELHIAEEDENVEEKKENIGEEDSWEDIDEEEEKDKVEGEDECKDKEDGKEIDENNEFENKNYIKIFNKKYDPKKKLNYKKIWINKIQVLNTGELLLPSGKIVGHRMYRKYYKQKKVYRDNTILINLLKDKGIDTTTLQTISSRTGTLQIQRNIKELAKFNRKAEKSSYNYDNLRKKRDLKKNTRHNKVLTTYFRDSTIVFG